MKPPEQQDHLSVFLADPQLIAAFKEWVTSINCHLEGPFVFNPDEPDDETWFVHPFLTTAEFRAHMQKGSKSDE